MKSMFEFQRGRGLFLWLDRVGRWILAIVFLYAGVPKLADPQLFATIIGAYGLLPDSLLLPVAVLLPLAEVAAALLLFCGRREGLWLSAFMILLFLCVLGYGIFLGLDIDCGCFGPEDPEHAAFSGLRGSFIRDLMLCIPLLYGLYYHYYNRSTLHGEKR